MATIPASPVPSQNPTQVVPRAVNLEIVRPRPVTLTPPQVIITPDQYERSQSAWRSVQEHGNQVWWMPDYQTLSSCLTVHRAQFLPGYKSFWMFVIGPSGSGKSTFITGGMSGLSQVVVLGEMTPNTLLSCYKGSDKAFLIAFGSGTFLYKDFTTTLSQYEEVLKRITAQLREVADGYYVRHTGVEDIEWRGKISCVAAVTEAIDSYNRFLQNMGNRFVNIRWPRVSPKQVALKIAANRGRELSNQVEHIKRVKHFFECSPFPEPPVATVQQNDRLSSLCELVTLLRASTHRARDSREILDPVYPETGGHLANAIMHLPGCHASLFRRSTIEEDDIAVSARIGLDSVKESRLRIVKGLAANSWEMAEVDLEQLSGLSRPGLRYVADELSAAGAIEQHDNETLGARVYSMSRYVKGLWQQSFPACFQIILRVR